ncbi:MAG: hypothetical protein AAF351_01160 [Pseudomonadota bacterium]
MRRIVGARGVADEVRQEPLTVMIVIATFALTVNGTAIANEQEIALVEEAASRVELDFRDRWFFERVFVDDGVSWHSTSDPRRDLDQREELISVNGNEPTDKEHDEFAKRVEEGNAARQKDREAGNESILSMVEVSTLKLIDESDAKWIFAFQPTADTEEDREFMAYMAGRLTVVKNGRYIEQLLIQSETSFKPRTGVKIDAFSLDMRFEPVGDGQYVLPQSIDTRITGKAFMIADLDQEQKVVFSNYRLAARD